MAAEQSQKQPPTELLMDPVSRRKLQNRLNQRASRKRKQAQKQRENKQRGRRWIIYTPDSKDSAVDDGRAQGILQLTTIPNGASQSQDTKGSSVCSTSQLSPQQFYQQLRMQLIEAAGRLPPSPTLIYCVKQYNTIRALFENAAFMGLTMDMLSEDIASSFNLAGPNMFHLPPSLQPSSTQKRIIHHPWIDLFPVPSIRDSLIMRMSEYDEVELCGDLSGLHGASEVGLLVWGNSWDPWAYELSEEVIRKWCWLLKDSPELLASTNYWRGMRGEQPLHLAESNVHSIYEIE